MTFFPRIPSGRGGGGEGKGRREGKGKRGEEKGKGETEGRDVTDSSKLYGVQKPVLFPIRFFGRWNEVDGLMYVCKCKVE